MFQTQSRYNFSCFFRMMLTSFKRLFSNKEYVLIVGCKTCEAFKISGAATCKHIKINAYIYSSDVTALWSIIITLYFYFAVTMKYLEVGFGKSAATSSFLIGK